MHNFRSFSRASVTGGAGGVDGPGEPGPGEPAIQRALYAGNFPAAVDAALEVLPLVPRCCLAQLAGCCVCHCCHRHLLIVSALGRFSIPAAAVCQLQGHGTQGARGDQRTANVATTSPATKKGFKQELKLSCPCRRRSGMQMRWALRRCRARRQSCLSRRRSGTWRRRRGPTCCWRAASWTRTSEV